jgi:hypothetical protein
LANRHLSVPSSPGLGGCEHSTSTAHVSESTLTCSVGTTTRDSGNTSNSTTSTPRFSRVVVTSKLGNGVSLSLVL